MRASAIIQMLYLEELLTLYAKRAVFTMVGIS